ncbi:MAG: CotH kinase family protein [Myxococcota bacterium]
MAAVGWILLAGCPGGLSVYVTDGVDEPAAPDLTVRTDPTSTPTAPTPEPTCAVPLDGASLCVNELQSNNDATFQPGADGVFPDWVELYNAGDAAVDPASIGWWIGDAGPFALSGAPIEPGGHRVVILDDQPLPDHLSTGIAAEGEQLRIAVDGHLADVVDVPALSDDTTYGRSPDAGAWITACTASPGAPNAAEPCDDALDWVFTLGRIHPIRLYVDPVQWAQFETSALFAPVPATATLAFDGGVFPAVEIEPKGGYGSFRTDLDTQKVAFKIDLNAIEDHGWHGLERLTLNNLVQDPTFTHEYLTYSLFREVGLAAPRVGFARVYVNDVYFGFYAIIEPIDDGFLDRNYPDGTGHLVESAYGPDFDLGDELLFSYDEGPDAAAAQALIVEVSQLLATSPWDETTYATLRTLVDMDEVMANMAVEHATWHWDGYTTENNYYLYHEPTTSLWTMIPHGADQTWTAGWPNPYDGNGQAVLYQFCAVVPSCWATYASKVVATAEALDRLQLEGVLDQLIALTEPEMAADPRAEQRENRPSQLATTRARIQSAPGALRDAAATH